MATKRTRRAGAAAPVKPKRTGPAPAPPAPSTADRLAEIGRGIARVVGDVGAVAAGATRRGARTVAVQVAGPVGGLRGAIRSTMRSVVGGPAKPKGRRSTTAH